MRTDHYGTVIVDEADLCSMYMRNPTRTFINPVVVDQLIVPDPHLELAMPQQQVYQLPTVDITQWDKHNQEQWLMPAEYQEFPIVEWLIDQCTTDQQLQRVGEELLLYTEAGRIPFLRYLKYLVDTMRSAGIVWGVGRGSSVCSYVLYLIGVHRIDSLQHDLPVSEFLK